MPTVRFYDVNPGSIFPTGLATGVTYTGPGSTGGTAIITDGNGVLTDDGGGGGPNETATADITIDGGASDIGAGVEAERVWTLFDTVTSQTFQIAHFDVDSGPAAGNYLLSEYALVSGRVYDVVGFDNSPGIGGGELNFSYADYAANFVEVTSDGTVSGGVGPDTIDVNYVGDPEGDLIDDVPAPVAQVLDWTDEGGDEDDLSSFFQDTGVMTVEVTIAEEDGFDELSVETETQYVEGGEPFDDDSGIQIIGDGSDSDSATITLGFEANDSNAFEDEVQNVQFRINDIDSGTFQDVVTVRAYDANDNLITVNMVHASGDDAVTLNPDGSATVTAGGGLDDPDEADGSVLVTIAGPVARVEIDYDNGDNTTQFLYVSDVHFEAVPAGSYDDIVEAGGGNDTIDAGLGADTVYGQAGNDIINVGNGDTAFGDFSEGDGAGDNTGSDTFIINPDQLTGDGEAITIHGGEALDESDDDVLDFNGQLLAGSIVYSETDNELGGLSGTATLLDGTIVTFTGIEEIICFARGTHILTDTGEVAIEDLTPGQKVATLDHGLQPLRWIGHRSVPATGNLAPIVIRAGVLGNTRDLRVSPQHRMLVRGAQAQLLFGEDEVLVAAKHLTNWDGVFAETGGAVEYFHMMFDRHQIVFAEGAASESFHPGAVGIGALEDNARAEVLHLFPELSADLGAYGPTARMCLKQYEARLLVH